MLEELKRHERLDLIDGVCCGGLANSLASETRGVEGSKLKEPRRELKLGLKTRRKEERFHGHRFMIDN
jgi:hypothetical protein